MARVRKDGKYINYYIDRILYERLKSYADDKGQTVTTALERILKPVSYTHLQLLQYWHRYLCVDHHKG